MQLVFSSRLFNYLHSRRTKIWTIPDPNISQAGCFAIIMAYSNEHTNYIAYRDPEALGQARIGHLNIEEKTIIPLSFLSGTALTSLYQVIEVGEKGIKAAGEAIPVESVTILPPISGRDILCVGKNYSEHAKEFNSSGFDSSDKVDIRELASQMNISYLG